VLSSLATLAAIAAWRAVPVESIDDCALPRSAALLAPSAQTEVVRHAMACRDLERGRITRDDYRRLLGVLPFPPGPATQWASSVLAVSSQYSVRH
jgi:hypothetical protein